MISYAQNFEDVILERIFKDKEDGFYIDVGACDPTIHSVTKHFYDKGWRGINIEPSDYLFKKLQAERERDVNLKIAITQGGGEVTLYEVPNSGLSSIYEFNVDRINYETLKDFQGNPLEGYRKTMVESLPLRQVFAKYVADIDIDFLKIDVEGAEKEVIVSNDWRKFRPKVVIVEATRPSSPITNYEAWERVVLTEDYVFVYFDGLNRFYLRNDLLEWRDFFSHPPCVFDEFVTFKEQELGKDVAQTQAELLRVTQTLAAREQELGAQISQAQTELASSQARAHWLENEWNAAKVKIDELNQNSHHWWTVADGLNHQIQAIYASRSWRITAPLRLVGKAARWFVRGCIAWLTFAPMSRPHRIAKSLLVALKNSVSIHPASKLVALRKRADVKSQDGTIIAGRIEGPEQLSARARQIYHELKAAIEKNKKER
jgi:FkbM family methyltransferase